MGSLYFLNPEGVCWESGCFEGGWGGENTIGVGRVSGGGEPWGRSDEAAGWAGSCREFPQFSQNNWSGSAFVPHTGQKVISIPIACTIHRKNTSLICQWYYRFFAVSKPSFLSIRVFSLAAWKNGCLSPPVGRQPKASSSLTPFLGFISTLSGGAIAWMTGRQWRKHEKPESPRAIVYFHEDFNRPGSIKNAKTTGIFLPLPPFPFYLSYWRATATGIKLWQCQHNHGTKRVERNCVSEGDNTSMKTGHLVFRIIQR